MTDMNPHNLFWLDLETTGLDPATGRILEVGVIITDQQLTELYAHRWLVRYTAIELDDLAERCHQKVFDMHSGNGLWADLVKPPVGEVPLPVQGIDTTLRCLAEQTGCAANQSPLCGASAHFDRKWCETYMPQFLRVLHYRNLDVTTLLQLNEWWFGVVEPKDTASHRALDDIRRSIALLRRYRTEMLRVPA